MYETEEVAAVMRSYLGVIDVNLIPSEDGVTSLGSHTLAGDPSDLRYLYLHCVATANLSGNMSVIGFENAALSADLTGTGTGDVNLVIASQTRWQVINTTYDLVPTIDQTYDVGSDLLHINSNYVRNVRSSGANLTLRTETGHSVNITTNLISRWNFNANGDLVPVGDQDYSVGTTALQPVNVFARYHVCSGYQMDVGPVTNHDLRFQTDQTPRWMIGGNNGNLIPVNDDDVNIGSSTIGVKYLYMTRSVVFDAVAAATVPNNSLFRDSADDVLKFKDNGGTVNALYT